jgi:hypothetical protein
MFTAIKHQPLLILPSDRLNTYTKANCIVIDVKAKKKPTVHTEATRYLTASARNGNTLASMMCWLIVNQCATSKDLKSEKWTVTFETHCNGSLVADVIFDENGAPTIDSWDIEH